jgi:hypothetical protein
MMNKRMNSALMVLLVCFVPHSLTGTELSKYIHIGQQEQLFLDNDLVEQTENIIRQINRVEKYPGGPIVQPDKPWEGNIVLLFGTVMLDHEDELYKMWYYSSGDVGYATSHDGVHWKKPELGIVVRDGQNTNLVIERGNFGHFYEFCGVVKDPKDPDPNRRYKAGFVSIQRDYHGEHEAPYHRGQRRGLGTAVSPDGIHWTLEKNFASYEIFDISRFFWDERVDRFVLFGRNKLTTEKTKDRWKKYGWGRAVTRIESRDFENWTKEELVLAADARDPEGTEIYSMSVFPYGDLYIGCVQMFYGLPDQGNLDIQLAVSRNGMDFSRVEPRESFIPQGDIGTWDRFNISLGNLAPVSVGDEQWFYYSGRTYRHSPYKGKDTGPFYGAIGLAKIKRGRFVSLQASYNGGSIMTKPLRFNGSHLFVNGNARFGSIEITIFNQKGEPLSGFHTMISGKDHIEIPVVFENANLDDIDEKAVKIQFKLVNAQLFGFQFR